MRLAVVTRPKPDARGTLPLYVRVEHGGVTRYVSLGLRIAAKDWNPRKQQPRASHANAPRLGAVLSERLALAEDAALTVQASGRHFTADRIRDVVQATLNPQPEAEPVVETEVETVGMLDYLDGAIEGYLARGEVATAYAYRSGVRHLARWAEARALGRLPFEAFTPAVARAWHADLAGRYKPNTVHKYVSGVKTMLAAAAEDGVEGAEAAARALRGPKLKKERAEKARLTIAQVLELAALPGLAGRAADVRDWYVFAFFVGGMRVSDVCLLRWDRVDRSAETWRVRWRQKKTGEANALPALGLAQDVLERWYARTGEEGPEPSPFVFGLLAEADVVDPKRLRSRISNWNALANAELYAMQARIGAPKTGFHSARHSLADHLRRSGVDLYTISKALGHANTRITETYLRSFDAEDMDAKLGRAFSTPELGPS